MQSCHLYIDIEPLQGSHHEPTSDLARVLVMAHMDLPRRTISVGNTSSNHWFSRDMLVFKVFTRFFPVICKLFGLVASKIIPIVGCSRCPQFLRPRVESLQSARGDEGTQKTDAKRMGSPEEESRQLKSHTKINRRCIIINKRCIIHYYIYLKHPKINTSQLAT